MAGQRSNRTVDEEVFVYEHIVVSGGLSPEEPNLIIRSQSPPLQIAPIIKISSRDPVGNRIVR
jgi:hypothetical protein